MGHFVQVIRFVFYAARTGVLSESVPKPGQENPDFRDMQRFKKYGIHM